MIQKTQGKVVKTKKVQAASKRKKKFSNVKKGKEKLYSQQDLENALDAIKRGSSFRVASKTFGVPKSTLERKLKGAPIITKKGPATVLTESEEKDLVTWILYCARQGQPVTKRSLLAHVQKYIISLKRKNPFTNNKPGKHWYAAFMKRHPNLSERVSQSLTRARAEVEEADIRNWFDQVKKNHEIKGILKIGPERVFNLDESSFRIVPPDGEVIAEKGARSVYRIVNTEKTTMTVLFTASAAGDLLPPVLLFNLKQMPKKNVLEKIPPNWGIGNTDKGWMTSESFFKFIKNVFYKWLTDNNVEFPVILYADKHTSHFTAEVLRFAKEHKIELTPLYPNSTHILQPLDVSFFRPAKAAYKQAYEDMVAGNDLISFNKSMFAPVLKKALESRSYKESIINGFKSSGLYPFDENAVDYSIFDKRKKRKDKETSTTPTSNTPSSLATEDVSRRALVCVFEQYLISEDTLKEFRDNIDNEIWVGDSSKEELFYAWKKLRKLNEGNLTNCPATSHSSEQLSQCTLKEVSDSDAGELIVNESSFNSQFSDNCFDGTNYFKQLPGAGQQLRFNGEEIVDEFGIPIPIIEMEDDENLLLDTMIYQNEGNQMCTDNLNISTTNEAICEPNEVLHEANNETNSSISVNDNTVPIDNSNLSSNQNVPETVVSKSSSRDVPINSDSISSDKEETNIYKNIEKSVQIVTCNEKNYALDLSISACSKGINIENSYSREMSTQCKIKDFTENTSLSEVQNSTELENVKNLLEKKKNYKCESIVENLLEKSYKCDSNVENSLDKKENCKCASNVENLLEKKENFKLEKSDELNISAPLKEVLFIPKKLPKKQKKKLK